MTPSNKRKMKQLGMPYGTACGRLRKQVMFQLLQRLGEAVCFQCGKPIETVADLSLEHKQPWLGEDAALFWDLDNIAFSHLRCNVAASRSHGPRTVGRSGYKGVVYTARKKTPWRAYVYHGGQHIHIGSFATPERAAIAYDNFVVRELGSAKITNRKLGLLG